MTTPLWQQIDNLFHDHGAYLPPTRLRDELVVHLRSHNQLAKVTARLNEITTACENDHTSPLTEGGECPCGDDESVGGDGPGGDLSLTFGMIRRARTALDEVG